MKVPKWNIRKSPTDHHQEVPILLVGKDLAVDKSGAFKWKVDAEALIYISQLVCQKHF